MGSFVMWIRCNLNTLLWPDDYIVFRVSEWPKVLRVEWWCPLLVMMVIREMQCCSLVVIHVEWSAGSILMGRYLNSAIRLVFSIKLLKSLPKLPVGLAGPMDKLIQISKLVTSYYTIMIGHYEAWGFLGHGIFIFTYTIFFTKRWCAKSHSERKYFFIQFGGLHQTCNNKQILICILFKNMCSFKWSSKKILENMTIFNWTECYTKIKGHEIVCIDTKPNWGSSNNLYGFYNPFTERI